MLAAIGNEWWLSASYTAIYCSFTVVPNAYYSVHSSGTSGKPSPCFSKISFVGQYTTLI